MKAQRRSTGPSSIANRVRGSVSSIVILLVIPAVLSLSMMILYALQYRSILSRMEHAALLRPVVEDEIPERLFSVAAGRVRFEESGILGLLDGINGTLDELSTQPGSAGELELTVVRRTMGTLSQYVLQVRDGMDSGRPIDEIEAIVDEVRDVSSLAENMLSAFISAEITAAAQVSRQLMLLIILTAAAELLLAAYALLRARSETKALARSIRTSILKLEASVHRLTSGELSARVPAMDLEELQELADQINSMADRLEALIAQIKADQADIAKYELRLLQAQINPHFLYNTLDTIIWQAESGRSDEVIRLTRSLSDFFRITLSSGAEWITVAQEFRHIESYLSIQKTRYRDILDYRLDLPAVLENAPMVKLLLQPLVENALYHGIKARRGGGLITVSAEPEGARMRFRVADTGKGMTEEQVKEILASFRMETAEFAASGHGFGLRNVDMRIRLYYDQEEGLRIESGPSGTVVSFSVPVAPPDLPESVRAIKPEERDPA